MTTTFVVVSIATCRWTQT